MTGMTTATPLPLDKRQRAMLKEIGVRVWSPLVAIAPAAPVPVIAIESIAEQAINTKAVAGFEAEMPPQVAPSLPATPHDAPAGARWQFDAAHALFADAPPQPGPRWLVLAEAPPEPTTAQPLDGDAGQLLGNMLRAARLAHPGRVVLVPLRRLSPGPIDMAAPSALAAPLAALVAAHQPDLLLVMGRLAAQALLHTTEPLGKLRGRVHTLQGVPTVVTYDAQPLLRTPADKAKAWDDLCLGMATAVSPSVASEPGG
ncbi:MAG: uracil-DNA glycosylase family protein [Polaromonas sp.]